MPELRVAIVGAGTMARAHSAALAMVGSLYPRLGLRVRLTAVSDVNLTLATDLAGRYGYGRVDPDWRAMVAAEDVDLVVACLPPILNREVVLTAAAAGKHIVCEKPLAESAAVAAELLCVFQNRRWDGDFLTLRGLIEDGTLGPIDSLEARFERWSPVSDEWRESAADAGGPLRDLGAHLVDQSLVLFGPVRRVWAQADRRRAGSQVEDSAFVALDHAGGVRSRLWMSVIAARPGPRLRVRGLNGEYIKHDLDVQEAQLVGGMRPSADGFGREAPEQWGILYPADGPPRPVSTRRGQYGRFYELLRDAVRGDGEPPMDPVDSVRALRVLDAAELAASTGAVQILASA